MFDVSYIFVDIASINFFWGSSNKIDRNWKFFFFSVEWRLGFLVSSTGEEEAGQSCREKVLGSCLGGVSGIE